MVIASAALQRLVGAVITIWAVATVLFVLVHLAPGDPAAALGGDFQTAQTRESDLEDFGLTGGIAQRYTLWIGALSRAELGASLQFRAPVLDVIAERLPVTLGITLPAVALSSLIGIALALLSSRRPGQRLDRFSGFVVMLWFALPVYWVAHILISVFSVWLNWLPVQGLANLHEPAQGWMKIPELARHLTLPIAALLAQQVALVWLVTRAGLLEARNQPHFTTALAKGLSVGGALRRHALRQAGLGLVTVIGSRFASLLTAATLVETVFGLPGIGRLLVSASLSRDYPLALGIMLIAVALTLLANAVTDAVYALLDPRIGSAV